MYKSCNLFFVFYNTVDFKTAVELEAEAVKSTTDEEDRKAQKQYRRDHPVHSLEEVDDFDVNSVFKKIHKLSSSSGNILKLLYDKNKILYSLRFR